MHVTSFTNYKNEFLPKQILDALEEAIEIFNISLPDNGEYPLQNGAKAIVMRYSTKDYKEVQFEDHQLMTDIQIVLSGEEYAYIADKRNMTAVQASEEEAQANLARDIQFYNEHPQEYARVHLNKNAFCIIYPNEVHATTVQVTEPKSVVKMVIKVPMTK